MIRKTILAVVVSAMPVVAAAMPTVGDIVGTSPDVAKAALEKAGCSVNSFDAEDGKIEAKCLEVASGKNWEVYLDPKTGAVVDMKSED